MYCTNCGSEVQKLAVACPKCGVPPKLEHHFCAECGTAVTNPKQIICLQCGLALSHKTGGDHSKFFDAQASGIRYFDIITKKYVLFKGRARRKEIWKIFLINFLIVFGLVIAAGLFFYASEEAVLGIPASTYIFNPLLALATGLMVLFPFALLLPTIAVGVRRMHDLGYSGWFWLINLIPYIGGLIFLILCCLNSQKGDNQYGPNPKGEY
jgi:uncharacterized membrane protein YhaH (DUF805 family)